MEPDSPSAGEHVSPSQVKDGKALHGADDATGPAPETPTEVNGLFLHHPAVMLAVRPQDGAILQASQAACRFYGVDLDKLLSMRTSDLEVTPDRHRAAGGALRDVVVQAGPMDDSAGSPHLWFVTDVTAEREAQREARHATTRLREAERLASLGTWETDLHAGRVQISDGLYAIYGQPPSPEAVSDAWFLEIMHPEDRPTMEDWRHTLTSGRGADEHSFRVIRPDGTTRHVRGVGTFLLAADGTPERAFGVARDVTAEVEAARVLHDREQRLRLAIAAGGHVLFDLDFTTGNITVSDEYARMLGYDRSTFTDADVMWRERVHPDDLPTLSAAFDAYANGTAPEYRIQVRLRTAQGDWRWVLWTGQIVETTVGGAPRRMLGTQTDITALKRNEERMEAHVARARSLLDLWRLAEVLAEPEILSLGTNLAESLTRSRMAFIHFVAEDQRTFTTGTWSAGGLRGCEVVTRAHWSSEQSVFWGDVLRTQAPVVIQDFATYPGRREMPDGHHPLERLLAAPLLEGGLVRMVIGAANKATDYDGFDNETLQLLSEQLWRIVHGRRAAAAAADSARFAHLLLENLEEGVVACDAEGRLSVFNKSARVWHGAPPNPGLNQQDWASSYDLFEADGVTPIPTARIPLVRAFRGEEVVDAVIYIVAHGQPPRLVLCSGGPLFDDAGTKAGALMVLHDITEIAASRATQSLQVAALDAAANAIVITDRRGGVSWANRAFTDLTGFETSEAVGRDLRGLLNSGVHSDAFYAEMWSTIVDGRVWSGELTSRRKDGTLYPEAMTITPVRAGSGEITHFIAIKRALTAERAIQAQLLHAQKMDSVGRLAGGIAHDFNNLLTVINGTVELNLSQMRRDDPLFEDLEEVHAAAGRAAALTRQLLAFSRQQLLKREVVHLDQILQELTKMLRRLIGEHIELVAHLDPVGTVVADKGQIEQVIVNLCINARDAMPDGGRLEIATREVEWRAEDPDRAPSVPPGRYAEVSVTDSGHGMDADTKARLFEPFFTTKEAGKGTGLGLATVYGIVTQSGGHILLSSEVGQGARFVVLLPIAESTSADSAIPAPAPTPRADHATVLVVDDEEPLRNIVKRMLSRSGHKVYSASGGAEALQIFDQPHPPEIDLVLTDVVMPEMSGLELVSRLRSRHPNLRVLYMTGYTDDQVLQHGLGAETKDFLNKPFTIDDLTRRVREALDGR